MATWANSQPVAVDAVTAVAGHAMAGAHDPAELLGVDVQQLAGRIALVAQHRRGRFERLEAGEPQAVEHPADRRHASTDDRSDGTHGHARTAQLFDAPGKHFIDRGARLMRPGAAIEQSVRP